MQDMRLLHSALVHATLPSMGRAKGENPAKTQL